MQITKQDVLNVGTIIANSAMSSEKVQALVYDSTLPYIVNRDEAESAISKVVYQDRPIASKRIWATLGMALTAALSVPEVQALFGPWAPAVLGLASALLAFWSKAADPRPTK